MRGGPLSDPDVIAALQPFLVAFWAQKDRAEPPPEVRALYDRATGRSGSNVTCFVLDSSGRLLRDFNGFPEGAGAPVGPAMQGLSRHWAAEIAAGAAKTRVPERTGTLVLPETADGVRLFVRLPETKMFASYRSPVVEVVPDEGEWKTLARSREERTIEAARLARWLRLVYPPGVNEQLKPYDAAEGKLRLTPVDADTAVLLGTVKLSTKERPKDPFEGTLRAVVTYARARVKLRGVVEGIYPRFDPAQRRRADWTLTAAIESRPE